MALHIRERARRGISQKTRMHMQPSAGPSERRLALRPSVIAYDTCLTDGLSRGATHRPSSFCTKTGCSVWDIFVMALLSLATKASRYGA